MKRKMIGVKRASWKFDPTEFLLLLSVTLVLLVYFAWQVNLLPAVLKNSLVLGVSTAH